jgi:hypothetical protein
MSDYVTSDSSSGDSNNESIGICPGGKLAADPNHNPNAKRAWLKSPPVVKPNNNKKRTGRNWQVHCSEFARVASVYIKIWLDVFSQDT